MPPDRAPVPSPLPTPVASAPAVAIGLVADGVAGVAVGPVSLGMLGATCVSPKMGALGGAGSASGFVAGPALWADGDDAAGSGGNCRLRSLLSSCAMAWTLGRVSSTVSRSSSARVEAVADSSCCLVAAGGAEETVAKTAWAWCGCWFIRMIRADRLNGKAPIHFISMDHAGFNRRTKKICWEPGLQIRSAATRRRRRRRYAGVCRARRRAESRRGVANCSRGR